MNYSDITVGDYVDSAKDQLLRYVVIGLNAGWVEVQCFSGMGHFTHNTRAKFLAPHSPTIVEEDFEDGSQYPTREELGI